MVEASKGLVMIKLDCSGQGAYEDLRTDYGVPGYPTVVFIDADGQKVDEFVGARDAGFIREKFVSVAETHGP